MSVRSWLIRVVLRREVGAVQKGKRGDMLKKAYWWAQGKKTFTGVALLAVWGALWATGNAEAADWVVQLGGFLVTVGLLDKTWRAQPPQKP